MLLDVTPSRDLKRKYTAVFSDGARVDFGGMRADGTPYGDYTIHYARCGRPCADAHRARYIARHRVGEDWSDPKKRGTLARYLLWEYPVLDARAIRAYNERFYRRTPTRPRSVV